MCPHDFINERPIFIDIFPHFVMFKDAEHKFSLLLFFRSNRHTFELYERKTKDRDKNLCFIYSFFIAIRLDFNSLIQEGIRIEKGFKLILGCQPDHCFQLLSV